MRRRVLAALFGLAAMPGDGPQTVAAQDMENSVYWRYLPLAYTRPVRQASGTAALHLYGNPADAGYRDESPVDGIDDRRQEVLHRLGVRFAPYLVLNTTAVPMDWKKFMNGRMSWPLFIDNWNHAVEGGELTREDQVDWLKLRGNPCPNPEAETPADNDDCRLIALLREFDPEEPRSDLGIEYLPIASFVPPPRGLDLGIRLEYTQFRHDLDLDKMVTAQSSLGSVNDIGVLRHGVTLAVTIGL